MWCWRRLLSPLDSKKTQPVNRKWNHSWIFIGRTDAEAKAPKLWQHYTKSWLIRKDPDDTKDWRQEEREMIEDEMAGGITDTMDMGLSSLRELRMDRETWRAFVHGVTRSQTQLSNWTEK